MSPLPEDELDDLELIALARSGGSRGSTAYSVLVRRHQANIVRLTTYLLGGATDAEDVAQEAFVRAYSALDRFPEGGSFRAWMRVIATRLAFNQRRDGGTRKKYQDQIDAPPPSGDRVATREALERVMAELPYPFREILVLRYVEELSISEIATLLELGESAAKMRFLRARENFDVAWGRLTG